MLSAVSALFWFIVTFSILVVLHEGGHFLVARSFGVHVHEFMIGLPGPAIRFHGKKTDYGITAVPLGGYVRITGMNPHEEIPEEVADRAYFRQPARAKPIRQGHPRQRKTTSVPSDPLPPENRCLTRTGYFVLGLASLKRLFRRKI